MCAQKENVEAGEMFHDQTSRQWVTQQVFVDEWGLCAMIFNIYLRRSDDRCSELKRVGVCKESPGCLVRSSSEAPKSSLPSNALRNNDLRTLRDRGLSNKALKSAEAHDVLLTRIENCPEPCPDGNNISSCFKRPKNAASIIQNTHS
ncbi:hypothetical protein KSP39_PZI023357 [Platanthera zijinensis]|uniref:Uncharacterized protein n=1 Tax=Platanthera zijinensis TaxID=2320716 RepID=A0AAP0FUX6_9ASPA